MPVSGHQILSRRRRDRSGVVLVRAEDEESDSVAGREDEREEEQEQQEEDDEDGDDDEDGGDESDSEETEEGEDDGEEVEYIEITDSPTRVCDGDGEKGAIGKGKDCSPSPKDSQEDGWDRNEIDGLFCPICMEAWASSGDHHDCSLPCGHIFGFSCISKWLTQPRSSRKCPQCNRKCTLKEVRKLFSPRIAAIDGESQKRIKTLEAKCISLEKKASGWRKKEAEWKSKQADWHRRELQLESNVCRLSERTKYLEYMLGEAQNTDSAQNHGSGLNRQGSFILQTQLQVSGARLFDVHHANQFLLLARRLPGFGGVHMLSKMSLLHPHESEDIELPSGTKGIRDLHVSPYNSSLALFAALGRKLSILSTESNSITISYDVPAPAWSCSWDKNSSHYIYAGQQDGSVLGFDIRQTARPMHYLSGLTVNPVHTIFSVHNSSVSSSIGALISASSAGICHWNISGETAGPHPIPGAENPGVCISLAYCAASDNIVASYRPSYFQSTMVSQTQHTPIIGQGVRGSHVHYKRVNNCYHKLSSKLVNVNDIRLPRSAIINTEKHGCLFAALDENMGELLLQELPSFTVVEHLKSPKGPIYDVKYTNSFDKCLLGALSEDVLQLFTL